MGKLSSCDSYDGSGRTRIELSLFKEAVVNSASRNHSSKDGKGKYFSLHLSFILLLLLLSEKSWINSC